MLRVGRDRLLDAGLVLPTLVCDAEKLPFADRPLRPRQRRLRPAQHDAQGARAGRDEPRAASPGGRLLVLEFSKVAAPLQKAYDWYSFNVLPRLGKVVAGDAESYRYLAESIRMHPGQEELKAMMKDGRFRPRGLSQPDGRRRRPACRNQVLTAGSSPERRRMMKFWTAVIAGVPRWPLASVDADATPPGRWPVDRQAVDQRDAARGCAAAGAAATPTAEPAQYQPPPAGAAGAAAAARRPSAPGARCSAAWPPASAWRGWRTRSASAPAFGNILLIALLVLAAVVVWRISARSRAGNAARATGGFAFQGAGSPADAAAPRAVQPRQGRQRRVGPALGAQQPRRFDEPQVRAAGRQRRRRRSARRWPARSRGAFRRASTPTVS